MNESLWINSSKGERYEKLDKNIEVECLIVGAGIAGITTAYLLCKKGVKVTVIDADYVGYGATGRNTGKLTPQHNLLYSKIKNKYGKDAALEYYKANNEGVNLVEGIINENNIECNFERVDSYIFTQDESKKEKIREEFDVCKEIGIDCEFTVDIPLPIDVYGAVKFFNTAQFNPKKYIDALAKAASDLGVKIYEKTSAEELEVGDINKVKTSNGNEIKAQKVIICSHVPFYDGLSFYFTRLKPERSYVVAGEYNGDFPNATFINIEEPARSLRCYENEDKRYLLIAGEKHKVGHNDNSEDYYSILKNYGNKVFGVKDYNFKWSAQDYIAPDYIPYIGYLNSGEKNIFVATGFAKWGMTNGSVAAMVLSDLYIGEGIKYENIFNPSRKDEYFSKEFIKENADVGIQYILGKLKIGSKDMPEVGEGKIISTDKGRYGAYRDENEELHIVDITCTHLGCELKWNGLEKSWDCPCHGSRFNVDGEILEGPANLPLKNYGEGKNHINPNIFKN